MRNFLQNWKRRAEELRTKAHALYLAALLGSIARSSQEEFLAHMRSGRTSA
jgi:hypothetical protein